MTKIDFKEIGGAKPDADRFEQFARALLKLRGFKVIEGPARGADGGKDLIVEEARVGVGGETKVRWLVSCKHNAHSGASVGVNDEVNIRDRVSAAECDGFLGFYSTLPSQALADRLRGLTEIEELTYDAARMEEELLGSPKGLEVAKQFFPKSVSEWEKNHPTTPTLFAGRSLRCARCDAELFDKLDEAIVVIWHGLTADGSPGDVTDVYTCCKGVCDRQLEAKHAQRTDLIDGWVDISDFTIPTIYLQKLMAFMNELSTGVKYKGNSYEVMRGVFLNCFPSVSRHLTDAEKEEVDLHRQYGMFF